MTYWKAMYKDDKLWDIYASLLEMAFKQGFTYDWWLKSIEAMLAKVRPPYYMKLCIIELFEWDYNAVIARFEQAAGFQNPKSFGAVQGDQPIKPWKVPFLSRSNIMPLLKTLLAALILSDQSKQESFSKQKRWKEATLCNM